MNIKKAPEGAFLSYRLVAIKTTKLNNNVPKDLLQCTWTSCSNPWAYGSKFSITLTLIKCTTLVNLPNKLTRIN